MEFPPAGKVYFMSYPDSVRLFLGRQEAMDSAEVDKNGAFILKPSVRMPAVFSLRCGNMDLAANLLIRPGDKLDFKFSGKDQEAVVDSKGEASDFNAFLLRFIRQFYKEPGVKNQYYIASNYMEPPAFEEYTLGRRDAMLDFYKTDDVGTGKDPLFRDYIHFTIQYEFACDRLMYIWKKRMKGHPVTPDSAYFSFAEPGFIENPKAFVTPSYIRFINLYLKESYESKVERGELPLVKGLALIPSVEKYRMARSGYHSPVQEALLYNLILNDLDPGGKAGGAALDSLEKVFRHKYSITEKSVPLKK
ncbi:MAG: hypothetical protein JNL88_06770 [Bacteroidia bacterium]|nr:hypothetical protein [Bacteroidia bacterium]